MGQIGEPAREEPYLVPEPVKEPVRTPAPPEQPKEPVPA